MFRPTIFFALFFIISLSSASVLRKSLSRSRRQDSEPCQAIEGFDCKCSSYRLSCTSSGALPQQINVLQDAKQKYPSVELIIEGAADQNVYDYTFEPVQQLYKPDADILELRVKFEKYTALHLHSPGVFNRVFPPTTPSNARKHLAVEIYNPLVQPNDNENLFAGLNVDSLELYVLYPFRGTFQQLFNGANIKNLRLSGGDVRSDLSQPFNGNIGRLELAKQASQLNVQNFPVYPAHELIINAFYVSDFTSENPPDYSNLNELRIHSSENVPANAFQRYPNLKVLSVSTEKEIDPHAFDGLYKLEKLTIKDTKPSLELLNSLYGLKEFETNVDKLSEREQCELAEKLANGQVVVQTIESGHQCTCVTAYLNAASNRYACDAPNCEQSSCPAIRNSYDATTRSFKAPPKISRADGSDAFRPADAKVYKSAYKIPAQDRKKVQQDASAAPASDNDQQNDDENEQPQQQPDSNGQDGDANQDDNNQEGGNNEGDDNSENTATADANEVTEGVAGDATDASSSGDAKKGWNWFWILIIGGAIAGLLLIGLIVFCLVRRKQTYSRADRKSVV